MRSTFYLKFIDESECLFALSGEFGNDIIYQTADYFIDVIPTLYTKSGEGENTVFTPKPGYHVNILIDELPQSLQQYAQVVLTPSREFATST